MTRITDILLAIVAVMWLTVYAAPLRCNPGISRHGAPHHRSLPYCRDEYDDDYDGEEGDWDNNEGEDFLDGGSYDNEDTDMGEDDYYTPRRYDHRHRHLHEA